MAAQDVNASWCGKTKDELVDLASWIPEDMRAHPRAYLVADRESRKKIKEKLYAQAYPDVESLVSGSASTSSVKRSFEGAFTSQAPQGLRFPPPPFQRPAVDPDAGECVSNGWDWEKSAWVMTYEDGSTVTVTTRAPGAARQQRDMGQNEQSHTRRSFKRPTTHERPTQTHAPVQSPAPVQKENAMLLDQSNSPTALISPFGSLEVESNSDPGWAGDYTSGSE